MKLYRFLLICAAAVTAACTEEPRDFDMTPAAPPAPEEQYAAPTNPLGSIVVAHRGGPALHTALGQQRLEEREAWTFVEAPAAATDIGGVPVTVTS